MLALAHAVLSTFIPIVADDDALATYRQQVKPLLAARCTACHGALKQAAGLRLDTAAAIHAGGRQGPVLEAGDPSGSELIARLETPDHERRMPPEGAALRADEIAALRRWIEAGAPAPADESSEPDPRDHWSFVPPRAPDVPEATTSSGRNLVDALLARHHQREGLQPVAEVEPALLLRRVFLDLIGLPPTAAELRAFEADPSPAAYAAVVESLLTRPEYGERWGRHWMDVWRYSDWYGLDGQLRHSQKHLWRWRDWIVDSLNEGLGYDEMLRRMLAGDEIAPTDPEVLVATGYLARSYYLFNRDTWLDDTVEHVGKAFLGLTLQCARCHDHKYDPISQQDYYSFRAFFEPHQIRTDPVPGVTALEQDGIPRAFDAHLEAPTRLYVRGDPKHPDPELTITPGVPEVFPAAPPIEARALPPEAQDPDLLPHVLRDRLQLAEREIEAKEAQVAELERQRDRLASADVEEVPAGALFLREDFRGPTARSGPNDDELGLDASIWELGPGRWTRDEHGLRQDEVGARSRWLRTRELGPADFEAVLRFTHHGVGHWRSVGLSFDISETGEKGVYLSAVQPGSKLQISYGPEGGTVYPGDAARARPVALDQVFELRVRVRASLIEVAVDGRHALSYRLPVPREPGRLSVWAFDAAASFHDLEVRALPAQQPLIEPGAPASAAAAESRLAVARAEQELSRLRPQVLRDGIALARARAESAAEALDPVVLEAAAETARRQAELERALRIARAEQALLDAGDESSREEAETRLAEARQTLEPELVPQLPPLRSSWKAPEGPDESEESRRRAYPRTSTGRRRALAQWITDRAHPLTARVAVNHVWLRHFGQPLVEPVSDFGRQTPAPPLQDLLDALALDFMQHGWSLRRLHRLMVTSEAYRRTTSTREADAASAAADPENRFLWRRTPQRMEAELLRDSLLSLAGVLDSTRGGPPLDPAHDDGAHRRSLYFAHSRDAVHPMLAQFDHADHLACYRRPQTILPQQALALANGALPMDMATRIAATVDEPDPRAWIEECFFRLLARRPELAEVETCLETLSELRQVLREEGADDPEARARADLVLALLNHNDFVTVR